jgi:pantoate--beta-alanine ligase
MARAARPIGLVPTMGALHDGHASLIRRAHADNATVLVTIFVNPRQFNEAADYEAYPREEAADVRVCGEAGANIVFIPPPEEIYPAGFQTSVQVGALTEPLEGASRPGHFEGVTTVVAILLSLAGADHAYFGQKDAQQLLVIRRMAEDLGIDTEIVACPSCAEWTGCRLETSAAERAAEGGPPRFCDERCWPPAAGTMPAGDRRDPARGDAGHARGRAAGRRSVRCADRTLHELERANGPALLSMASDLPFASSTTSLSLTLEPPGSRASSNDKRNYYRIHSHARADR